MRIVVGGRIPGYGTHAGKMTAREYIEKVMNKELHDPVLTSSSPTASSLKRLIPGYLDVDRRLEGLRRVSGMDQPRLRARSAPALRSPLRRSAFAWCSIRCGSWRRFRGVRRAVRVLPRRGLGLQVRLHPLPGDLHDAASVPGAGREPGGGDARLSRVHPALPRALHRPGGEVQRQRHRRLALHRRGRRSCYNIAYLFRRDGTLGKQYKLHVTPAERLAGASRAATGSRSSTPTGARSPSRSATTSSSPSCPGSPSKRARRSSSSPSAPTSATPTCGSATAPRPAASRTTSTWPSPAASATCPDIDTLGLHYAQSGIFTPSDIPFDRDAIAAECDAQHRDGDLRGS